MRRTVAVSACLLGENCRYDGETKEVSAVRRLLDDPEVEVVMFCPEDPVMGTPRERINLVEVDGRLEVITAHTDVKVTSAIKLETQRQLFDKPLDLVILKSKSPSCGLGTTPVVSSCGKLLRYGDGIAASEIKKAFADIEIIDEIAYEKGLEQER